MECVDVIRKVIKFMEVIKKSKLQRDAIVKFEFRERSVSAEPGSDSDSVTEVPSQI